MKVRWRLRRDPRRADWVWLQVDEDSPLRPARGMTCRVFDRQDAREWLPKLRDALNRRIEVRTYDAVGIDPVEDNYALDAEGRLEEDQEGEVAQGQAPVGPRR